MHKKFLLAAIAIVNLMSVTSIVAMDEETSRICFRELSKDNIEYFKNLLDNADANEKKLILQTRNLTGWSLLHSACFQDQLEIAQLLINYNAPLDLETPEYGNTPLHLAVLKQNDEIVQYLCKLPQINVNMQNKYRSTPLHFAVRLEFTEIVQILCKQDKIDINAQDQYDYTPLHEALLLDIVKYLCKHPKINVNIQDLHGETPLYKACMHGNLDTVKYLCTLPQITRIVSKNVKK